LNLDVDIAKDDFVGRSDNPDVGFPFMAYEG
jgi:hypothetical protein